MRDMGRAARANVQRTWLPNLLRGLGTLKEIAMHMLMINLREVAAKHA